MFSFTTYSKQIPPANPFQLNILSHTISERTWAHLSTAPSPAADARKGLLEVVPFIPIFFFWGGGGGLDGGHGIKWATGSCCWADPFCPTATMFRLLDRGAIGV